MISSSYLKLPRLVQAGGETRKLLHNLLFPEERVIIFSDANVAALPHVEKLIQDVRTHVSAVDVFTNIPPEPSVDDAQAAAEACREFHAVRIIAIGGGSVMDTAKLAGVLDTSDYTLKDLLDHPEKARRTAATLMIPTTAGTGAEATPNAIVTVPERELKVGIVNDALIADAVILDADVLPGLPAHVAAATGIDALAHAVECFTSKKATPFSDMFAMEAFRLIENQLETFCRDTRGSSVQTRLDLLRASFYAGVAIAASGTTAVHALSYPLGGKYHIPHGVANASLLLPVMNFNESACRDRLALLYDRVRPGQLMSNVADRSHWVLERISQIIHGVGIPATLERYGVSMRDLDTLTDAGMQVTRLLDNNLRPLTPDDARAIYRQILNGREDAL